MKKFSQQHQNHTPGKDIQDGAYELASPAKLCNAVSDVQIKAINIDKLPSTKPYEENQIIQCMMVFQCTVALWFTPGGHQTQADRCVKRLHMSLHGRSQVPGNCPGFKSKNENQSEQF